MQKRLQCYKMYVFGSFRHKCSLFQLCAKFTTEVVSNCIYGIDSKCFTEERSVLLTMGSSVLDSSSSMMIYFMLVTFFPIIKRFWKKAFIPKETEKFFMKLTMDAIKMRDEGKNQREDFINYVLQLRNKKNISNIDMAAHAITFFLDGFETSSTALSFTMYYLGKNKHVQEKLRKEIRENIGPDGRISFEKITDMQYLEQVFNGFVSQSTNFITFLNCFFDLQRVCELYRHSDSPPEFAKTQLN